MRKPIVERVLENSERFPNKTAILTPKDSISYGELCRLANGYGAFLRAQHIGQGCVVLTRAAQTVEYVILYLGVHLSGAAISSLEETTPSVELARIAKNIGANCIVDNNKHTDWTGTVICRDVLADAERFADMGRLAFPDGNDLADIMFTTGTTGTSKGVSVTHDALSATAENLVFGCGYRDDTIMVAPSPLNHAHAIRHLYTTLAVGGTFYLLNGMKNLRVFYQALDYPCDKLSLWLPPSALRMLFMLSGEKLGEYANKIEFLEVSTQPFPESDREKLCSLLPNSRLLNCYGSSESGVACMYDFQMYPGRAGCVGKPSPNTKILIVDDNRKPYHATKENPGLIACGGDANMKEYRNDAKRTVNVIRDGIVYTNDLGYMDDEGFVYIVGRQDDVINVGGLKVAPTEVEDAALGYAAIADCICVEKDHPISGQAPKLLVVMREGEKLNTKDIREYLMTRLESFKVPVAFEEINAVKRTYNGKIDRKAYR